MQGKRTRALDSRGRPVPGLYVRDGRFIAGFKRNGRWTMQTLAAETLTEARRERESLLAGLREGRVAAPRRRHVRRRVRRVPGRAHAVRADTRARAAPASTGTSRRSRRAACRT